MADEVAPEEAAKWPKSVFWTYSLDLYGRDGVEAACLALQARRGLDVNLVLFAFWLGSRGLALDPASVADVEALIGDFRAQVVRPLRAVRRHLRAIKEVERSVIATDWPDEVEQLRRSVAASELDGEHVIQLALERLSAGFDGGHPRGPDLAAANLGRIALFEASDHDDLSVLFGEVFPELAEAEIDRMLAHFLLGHTDPAKS